MKPAYLFAVFLAVGATGYILVKNADAGTSDFADRDTGIVAAGRQIQAQGCAACHGANLEGQANWRERDEDGFRPAPRMTRVVTPATIQTRSYSTLRYTAPWQSSAAPIGRT